jgi:hypothetical protein
LPQTDESWKQFFRDLFSCPLGWQDAAVLVLVY